MLYFCFGVVVGGVAVWLVMDGSPSEDFADVGWRDRLGGHLGIKRKDGGAHVCQLPQNDPALPPPRRRR